MTEPKAPAARPADPHFDYSSGAAELRGEVYRPPEYVEYLDKAVAAMRTVRLIVYAGMAGFIILAFYGFVLVYRLTTDVHVVVGQTQVMTQQMQAMSRSMANLNQSIAGMSKDVDRMTGSVSEIDGSVQQMSLTMERMAEAVTLMQHSARNLDQNVSPMMGTMNNMMPFGWPGNYGGPPPYAR